LTRYARIDWNLNTTLRTQVSHTCVWETNLTGLKGFETTASLFCQAKFVSLPNFLVWVASPKNFP
jgi:hypothetical protein